MRRRDMVWIGAVVALAVLARAYGAWCFRFCVDARSGAAALVAKHIAEGRGLPLTLYGYPRAGSLESMVGAGFCRVLGAAGFSVAAGTAVFGLLLLPAVYLWASACAGRRGAWAAVLCCILGPHFYFRGLALPQGGYAAALLFGICSVGMGVRIEGARRAGAPAGWYSHLLLGLAAGLAWWANPAAVPAILVAFGLLAPGLRGAKALCLAALAVLAFVGVALPLSLAGAQGPAFGPPLDRPAVAGLADNARVLLDAVRGQWAAAGHFVPVAGKLRAALAAGAVCLAAAAVFRRGRTEEELPRPGLAPALEAAFALIAAALVLAVLPRSEPAGLGPRLLFLVPACAVLLGHGVAWIARRMSVRLRWAAWLPVGLWLVLDAGVLPWAHARSEEARTVWQRYTGIVRRLMEEEQLGVAYVDEDRHWLNFALSEKYVFCALPAEPCARYAKIAEGHPRIALLSRQHDIDAFLDRTRGAVRRREADDLLLFYDFSPPDFGLAEVAPDHWAGATDDAGNSVRDLIADRSLETALAECAADKPEATIEITFRNPELVSAVRLVPANPRSAPVCRRIEGQIDGAWRPLTDEFRPSAFYWCGPRPYHGGEYFRWDTSFPPVTVSALRLVLGGGPRIAELEVFAPAEFPGYEEQALDGLVKLLAERGLKNLYADRWTAHAVREATRGAVKTSLEPMAGAEPGARLPSRIVLDSGTCLLARVEDAALCADVLAARGLAMRETPVGPWLLFDFAPDQWRDEHARIADLRWVGFGCLLTDTLPSGTTPR